METTGHTPDQQTQNTPEISGKLLPIIKDEVVVAYHGLMTAISENKRDRAGSQMRSVEDQEQVIANVDQATPDRSSQETENGQSHGFMERLRDRRQERKEWQLKMAESRRKKVRGAFGGDATLPGSSRSATSEVKRAFRHGEITARDRRTQLKEAELIRPMTEIHAQKKARKQVEKRQKIYNAAKHSESNRQSSGQTETPGQELEIIEKIKKHHRAAENHDRARQDAKDRLAHSRQAREVLKRERRTSRQKKTELVRQKVVATARKGAEYTGKAARYTYRKGGEHIAATRAAYHEGQSMSPDEEVELLQRGINRSARKAGRGYTKAGKVGTAYGWAAKQAIGYERDRLKTKKIQRKERQEANRRGVV